MAEHSGFFDAHASVDASGNVVYDRVYLAESFAKYFASFIGNGIFGGKSDELMVKQKETADMSIKVLSGQAFINGYFYENTDELSLAIDNADGVLNRIDLIVLRWDKYERVIRLAVEKGMPASSPSAPSMKRNDDYYELKLAEISVKAGATRITQADITDSRLNSDVCGFVVAVIDQFDTAAFNAQLYAWIDEFKLDSVETVNELLVEVQKILDASDLTPIINDIQMLKGSGLGGYAKQLTISEIEDLDPIDKNGWYSFILPDTVQVNGVNFQYGYMRVDNFDLASCTQTIYVVDEQGTILRRKKMNSVWGEFECENPPFAVDVEYRTTERIGGKVIYKMLGSDGIFRYRLEGETEWKVSNPNGFVIKVYQAATNADIDNAMLDAYHLTADNSIGHFIIYSNVYNLMLLGGVWHITVNRRDTNYGMFECTSYDAKTTRKMTRSLYEGFLQPIAWDNPPMSEGVEYRTTERFHDEVVYKKIDANGNILWRKETESIWRLLSSASYVSPATVE